MTQRLETQYRNALIQAIAHLEVWRRPRERIEVIKQAGLDSLLPMLDLEGSPFVVIGEVIDRLYESSSPALGHFLQSILQMTGDSSDWSEIRNIMKICLLGDVPNDLPPPSPDFFHGKVYETAPNPSHINSIAFFEQGLTVARAVALLRTPKGTGSGFLIHPHILMTNHHIIENREMAQATTFIFNYQSNFLRIPQPTMTYRAKTDGYFQTWNDPLCDVSLIELDNEPGILWGAIPLLPLNNPQPGEQVYIIHHPGGREKMVSFQSNFVLAAPPSTLAYSTPTERGSSGSPVFDGQWRLLAMHQIGGIDKASLADKDRAVQAYNLGIPVKQLLQCIPSHFLAP